MRHVVVFILLFLLIPCFSWSVPVEPPEITKHGSFKFMQSAAIKGHAKAAYFLGTYYYHGVGTAVDKASAVFWIKKAAEAGIIEAELGYGLLLLSGDGVAVDRSAALEWIGKAAKKNNAKAREVLQELLSYRGSGMADVSALSLKSYPEAVRKNSAGDTLRLEGKGVLLDQGTFGLKFTLPPLYDPLAPSTLQKNGLSQMLERLQGGTIDIIIRPAEK